MKAENANILVGVQVCRVMTPHQISECWDKGVVFFTSRKCSKGFLVSCHLILLMIPAMWNVVQARVALGGCTRTVKKSIRCETSPVMERSGLGIHGAHTHKIPRDYSLWLSLRTPHLKIARAKISCSQSLLLVDLKLLPVGLCRFPTYINSTEDVSGYRNGENWYHHTFSFTTPLTNQSINYKLLRGIGLVALLAYKCLRSYSVPYHVIHVVPCSFPFSPASPQCRNPSLGNSAPFLLLPGPVDVGIA